MQFIIKQDTTSHLRTRTFMLVRDEDISGVSGTGLVAYGHELSDGRAEVIFPGQWHSETIHREGMRGVEHVHCHGGKTRIVWAGEGSTDPIPFAGGHLIWVPDAMGTDDSAWIWTAKGPECVPHWDDRVEMEYRAGLCEGDHLCAVPLKGEQLWLSDIAPAREVLAPLLEAALAVQVTRCIPGCGGDPAAVSVPCVASHPAESLEV